MKRYVMALDLVDDPQLIKEYEDYHREVWPEIKRSILDAGVEQMEIYRFENRLFMNMEVGDDFSFEKKSAMDAANEKVQEWEQLMWKYQAAIPGAKPGEKWVMMTKIFELV
ncbi:MAG: L-rhamnose mutarotase [Sphingobacterium sp.]|jgi:L-rhamnose mutarotase|nr:L-rhamnose mutarotase [Sphingobacterium sp.]